MQKSKLSIKHLLSFKSLLLCRIQISPLHAECWYVNLRGRTCPDIEFWNVRELIPFTIFIRATIKLGHIINLLFLIYRLKRTMLGQFFVLTLFPHLHQSNLLRLPPRTGELPDFWPWIQVSPGPSEQLAHPPTCRSAKASRKHSSTWANWESPSALLLSWPLHCGCHPPPTPHLPEISHTGQEVGMG